MKNELIAQNAILFLILSSLSIIGLIIRYPSYIYVIYPTVCIIIFLSFVTNNLFISFILLSFFSLISFIGVIISMPYNRVTFLLTLLFSWAIFFIMNKHTQILENISSEFCEKRESGEIKLNEIKNKIILSKAGIDSYETRIKNYGLLDNFLNSALRDLGSEDFLSSLKKTIEGYLIGDVTLNFVKKEEMGFNPPSSPVISADSKRIVSPFNMESSNFDYAILKSGGQNFTDSDFRFFSMILDLSKIAVLNAELYQKTQSLSILDGLTSLYTRGYFEERFNEEFELAKGHTLPLSVAMIDIDYFKKINDIHGHATGDEVLKSLSYILRHRLRDVDIIGRYGGEEFAVIMPNTKIADAYLLAEDIRNIISGERFLVSKSEHSKSVHITISIGFSALEEWIKTPEELIAAADKNLYEAKNSGRNKCYPKLSTRKGHDLS